jgi:hypothetical protein
MIGQHTRQKVGQDYLGGENLDLNQCFSLQKAVKAAGVGRSSESTPQLSVQTARI